MEESDHGAVMAIGLVAALVGLLVGFGAAAILKINRPDPKNVQDNASVAAPDPLNKAADLRVSINALLQESASLSAAAVRANYDGRQSEVAAAKNSLNVNAKAFAAVIEPYLPENSSGQIQAAWTEPAARIMEYAAAIKRGDKAAVDVAIAALNRDNRNLSKLLSDKLSGLPQASVTEELNLYTGLLKNTADSYHAKDLPKSYDAQQNSYAPLARLADTITAAAIKQSPDKF
jgi:hypothetical protein